MISRPVTGANQRALSGAGRRARIAHAGTRSTTQRAQRSSSSAMQPAAALAPRRHNDSSSSSSENSSSGKLNTTSSSSSNSNDNDTTGAGPPLASRAAALAAAAVVAAASLFAPAGDGAAPLTPFAPRPAAARARLTAEEQLTVDVFKKAVPSVVNVTNLAVRRDAFTMNMLEIPQGAGSGFVWDNQGHIVTNYHVIQDASDIQVTALGGAEFSARVVGVDRDKDVAVLQITGRPGGADDSDADGPPRPATPGARPTARRVLPPAAAGAGAAGANGEDGAGSGDGVAGNGAGGGGAGAPAALPPAALKALKPMALCASSADLVVGQRVFAIGNPFGLDHTLTTGVISGTGREIQSVSGRPIQDVVQTDAAINPGNSGGPLLDSGGCLIGVNTAIYSPSGANSGVGFAIPVDVVRSSVAQIIETGRVVRPVLGISFAPDQSTEQLGVSGILVLSSREGGPAWRAGIRGTSRDEYGRLVLGDIITSVDGARVRNSSDLYRVLDKAKVGQALDIRVLRGNSEETVTAVLEANAS